MVHSLHCPPLFGHGSGFPVVSDDVALPQRGSRTSSVHLVIVSSDRTQRIVLEYSSEPFVLKYNVLVLCKNALTVNMYICAQLYLNVKEITCLPLNNQRRVFFEAECLTC